MHTQCTHMHMTKSTNRQQINATKPPNYPHIHFTCLYASTQIYHRIDAITTKCIPDHLVKWNQMSCVCLSEATPFYTFPNQCGRAAKHFLGKQLWYDINLVDLVQHFFFALISMVSHLISHAILHRLSHWISGTRSGTISSTRSGPQKTLHFFMWNSII